MLIAVTVALCFVVRPPPAQPAADGYELAQARESYSTGLAALESGDRDAALAAWVVSLDRVPQRPQYCGLRALLVRDLTAIYELSYGDTGDFGHLRAATTMRRRHLDVCSALEVGPPPWVEPGGVAADAHDVWTPRAEDRVAPSPNERSRFAQIASKGVAVGLGALASGVAVRTALRRNSEAKGLEARQRVTPVLRARIRF